MPPRDRTGEFTTGRADTRLEERRLTLAMPRKSTISEPHLPPIHTIRGQRVVLDSELAALYEVPTKRLNEQVKRNAARFPNDFCLRLTTTETAALRSQFATSTGPGAEERTDAAVGRGGRRYLPNVFTEHGALMAASVLNSPRAVQMSIYIVRAFVRMREELAANATILKRLAQIDKKLLEHDLVLQDVVEKLLPLLDPPEEETPKRRIGFNADRA